MGTIPGLVVIRLTSKMLWVRIPASDTGWTFFTYIVAKIVIFVRKKPKITIKEAWDGPI